MKQTAEKLSDREREREISTFNTTVLDKMCVHFMPMGAHYGKTIIMILCVIGARQNESPLV